MASSSRSRGAIAQIAKGKTTFHSDEERYDYAVSLLNVGHYEDARDQFKQIIRGNSRADYAFYGLAVLASMTGETHTCLEHLSEAIRLNPRSRIQARADSDFQDMADDPRFTELLYPEIYPRRSSFCLSSSLSRLSSPKGICVCPILPLPCPCVALALPLPLACHPRSFSHPRPARNFPQPPA